MSPLTTATHTCLLPIGDRYHSTRCPKCGRVMVVKNTGSAKCCEWEFKVNLPQKKARHG